MPGSASGFRSVVEEPGLPGDLVGEDEFGLAVLHGIREFADEGSDADPALAGIRGPLLTAGATVVREVELARLGAGGTTDHRVDRGLLAEVDARFVLTEGVAARPETTGEEDRITLTRALVAVGRDDAVAVGVDDGVVVPAARAVVETALVELTDGEHGVLHGAVDLVPVDVEVILEPVVLLDLLELRERRRDDRGVEDADARGRLRVGAERAGLGIRDRAVWHLLDVRDLRVEFRTRDGVAKAINGVSFHLDERETLAILIEDAADAVEAVLEHGALEAQQRFNAKR